MDEKKTIAEKIQDNPEAVRKVVTTALTIALGAELIALGAILHRNSFCKKIVRQGELAKKLGTGIPFAVSWRNSSPVHCMILPK